MTDEEILSKIKEVSETCFEKIIKIGREILQNPEIGFFELKTSEMVRKIFDELDIKYSYPYGITGVKGVLKGRKSNYSVCIIGEMDCVKCAGHKNANANADAHACGHNTQIAAMIGAACFIKESEIYKEFDGDVIFMAVPAEEFIELDSRRELIKNGKIKYMSGKQELIYEGAFDDVDMAIMIHAQPDEPDDKLYVRGHNLGFIAETITFKGKAAHGSTPQDGINALNAAALAILGIHSNRETFTEEDRIRIHPIITKGGDVVNSVPDEVCIDTYVRGATLQAVKKGENAVRRSVNGAAQMIGAMVEFDRIPGYLPLAESVELSAVAENAAKMVLGENSLVYGEEITGSTDIGDLSYIIPVIQPSIGGFSGNLHSKDFEITNENTVYIKSAQILALTASMLLANGAESAKKVKENFTQKMTKEQYIDYLNGKEE